MLWLGPTGLTIVRALGREGVPVVALHHDAAEPCVGTRYARVEILPSIDDKESAWLDFLSSEGRKLNGRKAVLIVAADAHWLFVARNRRVLEKYFLFSLPEAQDICAWPSKPWQHAAAMRAGIPCPHSATPRDEADLRRIAMQMTYPCILKPSLSHYWMMHYPEKLAFARSESELLQRGCDALSRGLEFTVQEYIPAEDHDVYGLFCYLDRDSRPLGVCVSHKIRQYLPRFGCASLAESVHQPRVVELGLRFLESIGFFGIASVEFKLDPRDGEFKFMEINMRAPLMMGHAVNSGVNLPYIEYRDLIGDPLPVQLPTRLGRRAGLLTHDFHSARFYRALGKLSWRQWLRQWLGTRDLHFALDDLAPMRGYVHGIFDQWRRGKFRHLPETFPSVEEWQAGEWHGTRVESAPRQPVRKPPQKMTAAA